MKSPATLIKRANSLLAFMRWAVRAGKGAECPFCEQIVWEYFQHLKASGAAATRAESTTSSLRFAFYLLGFESLESSLTSRRLIGICEIMLAGKRLIRQALTLTVPQILHCIQFWRMQVVTLLTEHLLHTFCLHCMGDVGIATCCPFTPSKQTLMQMEAL